MGRGRRANTAAVSGPVATNSGRRHRLSKEHLADLARAHAALVREAVPSDPLLAAARAGALSWTNELLARLEDLELSAPLAALEAADSEEWWLVEETIRQCDMQHAVLRALTGAAYVAQVAHWTHSRAYARHREAIEITIGRRVPHVALIVVDNPARDGDILNGWRPPSDDEPWAVVLTRPLAADAFDRTLLHELVHTTQVSFSHPVVDDKELEWVLGVGNTTLIEGATETLVDEVVAEVAEVRRTPWDLYLFQLRTFRWVAKQVEMTSRELALIVSDSDYPLDVVSDLGDWQDDVHLAWEILANNGDEIERLWAERDAVNGGN